MVDAGRVALDPGSSPRVRGTQANQRRRLRPKRFIPACAGNARSRACVERLNTVHPRVCGERDRPIHAPAQSGGSSPRVRGTRVANPWLYRKKRFIPACAGNASFVSCHAHSVTVHPRVCGERLLVRRFSFPRSGSSPRVRGTRKERRRKRGQKRFIPACAGNASIAGTIFSTNTVHPRVCGERGECFDEMLLGDGSSPRVRGTPGQRDPHALDNRFIPACAGNATDARLRWPACAVHPRVCGERE